jgi:hypothetical protein
MAQGVEPEFKPECCKKKKKKERKLGEGIFNVLTTKK